MTADEMVFPDTKEALLDLIDGTTHLGNEVRAVTWLTAGDMGAIEGPFPLVHIYGSGGTQGYLDRVDRRTIDVYAEGQLALNTLESISAFICGTDIETPAGYYLDSIGPDITPDDAQYQSDTLNKATATFLVTVRPLL